MREGRRLLLSKLPLSKLPPSRLLPLEVVVWCCGGGDLELLVSGVFGLWSYMVSGAVLSQELWCSLGLFVSRTGLLS